MSSLVSGSAAIAAIPRTADAAAAGASQVLQGYFTLEQGQLRFRLAVFDLSSQRNVREVSASAGAGDVLAAADRLAAQLSAQPQPLATRNPAALQAWGEALSTTDPAARTAGLERALAADPNFGPAYLELVNVQRSQGKIAEAIAVVDRARPMMDKLAPADRHRLELQESELRGDAASRQKALAAMVADSPDNVDLLKRMGEAAENARDWKSAVDALRKAAKLAPDDPMLANLQGYAEAYAGNFAEARSALERYAALQPNDVNPDDSLGEVHFYFGKFAEAEQYFLKAAKRGPGGKLPPEVQKAALSRIMRGDVAGADTLMAEIAPAANQPAHAAWLAVSGRLGEAIEVMRTYGSQPGKAAIADAHLSVWLALRGRNDEARAAADRCSRPGDPFAFVCSVLSSRPVPAPPVMQEQVKLYGLLLGGKYAEALPGLKRRYQQTTPGADTAARLLYAWALVETGHAAEAAPLVEQFPVALPGDGPIFAPVVFPRFLHIRAAALRAVGKQSEADAAEALYRKLTGGAS